MHQMNNYMLKQSAPKQLTEKQKETIINRQSLALMYKAKDKIEDYQNDVFAIIEEHGLNNENSDKKLKTALNVLEYIIPKKKSSEITINTRKIEDLIKDYIEEAEIIDQKTDNPVNNDKNDAHKSLESEEKQQGNDNV